MNQPALHDRNLFLCACLCLDKVHLGDRGQIKEKSTYIVLFLGNWTLSWDCTFVLGSLGKGWPVRKPSEQVRGGGCEAPEGTDPTRRQSPRKQAWAVTLSLVLVVYEGNRDKSRASEKILENATTYKLFPRTPLFKAPKCCISSGSEYSSPTMVGPTSCKVSHSGCLAGCQTEVAGLASPSSPACWP